MSKIFPHNYSNSGSNPYGAVGSQDSIDLGGGDEPWAFYGWNSGSYGSALEAYHVNLRHYSDSLMMLYAQLQVGDPRRRMVESYRRQTALIAQQYGFDDVLAEIEGTGLGSNWDPLTGMGLQADPYGGIYSDAGPGANPQVFPTGQDSQKVLYENPVPSFTADRNGDSREAHFYDYGEMTFEVPGSALARVTEENGAIVAVVQWNGSGITKRYVFHNNKKVNFEAQDFERQIIIDASVTAGRVERTAIGLEDEPKKTNGTPPDKTDSKTRTWNRNAAVDYFVTEGSELDKIEADTVNITLPDRSHTAYVTKTGAHEYSIQIRDETNKVVRRIHARQTDRLNFEGIDADNLYFRDRSQVFVDKPDMLAPKGTSPDDGYIAWSDPDCGKDSQLTLGGKGGVKKKKEDSDDSASIGEEENEVERENDGEEEEYETTPLSHLRAYLEEQGLKVTEKQIKAALKKSGLTEGEMKDLDLSPDTETSQKIIRFFKEIDPGFKKAFDAHPDNPFHQKVMQKLEGLLSAALLESTVTNYRDLSAAILMQSTTVSWDGEKFKQYLGGKTDYAEGAEINGRFVHCGKFIDDYLSRLVDGSIKVDDLIRHLQTGNNDVDHGDLNRAIEIRRAVSAIYYAADRNPHLFRKYLKMIPEQALRWMKDYAARDPRRKDVGDEWDGNGTVNVLNWVMSGGNPPSELGGAAPRA